MVWAYHVIFTLYGFWLPNDPRGSWSDWIRSWELLRYGGPTKTNARYSVAKREHDHQKRVQAKRALQYPPVILNGLQARAVARGFARACAEAAYMIRACAIMPDHVHLVVTRHNRFVEQVVGHFKARATQHLKTENLHPFTSLVEGDDLPSPWAQGTGWVVYLDSREDIDRSIQYVENNPIREGLRPQNWRFVSRSAV